MKCSVYVIVSKQHVISWCPCDPLKNACSLLAVCRYRPDEKDIIDHVSSLSLFAFPHHSHFSCLKGLLRAQRLLMNLLSQ